MKQCIIVVAAIFILSVTGYADELKCDYKYIRATKKLNAFSSEMSEETRNKWATQLKKVHRLCEEGQEEQAAEILKELRKDKDWDTVFSTHDGN